jgi:hypothetical protein
MAKDRQLRIDQTVDYIVGRVAPGERNDVRAFLTRWINTTYAGPAFRDIFSDQLSTDGIGGRGNTQQRAARRALVILRCEMIANGNPRKLSRAQVMGIPSGQVVADLDAQLPIFRMYAMQEEGANHALQNKLNGLKANPTNFLQNNLVVTQSAPPSPNGSGGVVSYRFLFHYASQSFMMNPAAANKPGGIRGNGIVQNVVNVPEMFWFNVPGRGLNPAPAPGNFAQIPATELTGADMMVTSAFTGCSFCFKDNAGHIYAAHISPDGTATGAGPNIGPAPTLADQIIATGDFSSPVGATAGALQVFGRGRSNLLAEPNGYAVNAVPGIPLVQASMYIIGSRIGADWTLVFQENNGGRRVGALL